jgi:AcrR family transcriptional regulator
VTEPSRTALLRSARDLFLTRGFSNVSMAQIRTDANVSNGSLFHHFPTKAHLARTLYVETLLGYQRAILKALDGGPSAPEGVAALVDAHVRWVTEHPDDARVLDELRDATRVHGAPVEGAPLEGESVEWKSVNAEAFSRLHAWIVSRVAAGDMVDLPLSTFMAVVFAPAVELTRAWVKKRPVRVRPSVREALVRGAIAAVTQPIAKKRSRGK